MKKKIYKIINIIFILLFILSIKVERLSKYEYLFLFTSAFIIGSLLFNIIRNLISNIKKRNFTKTFIFLVSVSTFLTISILQVFSIVEFTENKYGLFIDIVVVSSILLSYYLFPSPTLLIEYRKSYSILYKKNIFLLIFNILVPIVYYFVNTNVYGFQIIYLINAIALAFVISPSFDKNLIARLEANILKNISISSMGINSMEFVDKLSNIRTFVIQKKGIITDGNFRRNKFEHRHTIGENTVMNLSYELSKSWKPEYSEVFKAKIINSQTYEFSIIEKDENHIKVKDNRGDFYELSYTYSTQNMDFSEGVTLYLIKNKLFLAKIQIDDTIVKKTNDFVRKLNYLGNTVLISDESENVCEDAVLELKFDKLYANLTIKQQNSIIKQLNTKAPTALISNIEEQKDNADISFLINIKSNSDNNITIGDNDLIKVAQLIGIANNIKQNIKNIHQIIYLYNLVFIVLIVLNYIDIKLSIGIFILFNFIINFLINRTRFIK